MILPPSETRKPFKHLLPNGAKSFNLKILHPDPSDDNHISKRTRTADDTLAPGFFPAFTTESDGRNIAHFLINLQNLVSGSEKFIRYLDIVVTRLIKTTEVICVGYFEIVYLPYLEELMKLLPKTKVEIDGSLFVRFSKHVRRITFCVTIRGNMRESTTRCHGSVRGAPCPCEKLKCSFSESN